MPEEKDELRTLLLELTPEQMQQYYDFVAKCRKALDDARIAYVKSMIEGIVEYKNIGIHIKLDK